MGGFVTLLDQRRIAPNLSVINSNTITESIVHRIAMLTDGNIPRDVRRYKLVRELEAHKSAMKCMSEMMPNDHAAMAHAKAYLAALERTFDRRVYEMPHMHPLRRPLVR